MRNQPKHDQKELEKIWSRVPVDYYQKSIEKNVFQRLWHRKRLKTALSSLRDCLDEDQSNIKVLDVGCASGWFVSEISLVYPDAKYFGLDIYKEAVSYAKKLYPRIVFSVADAHNLTFSEDTFDFVVCTNVLEHVLEPEKVMREIKRVLKKNGTAVIGMDSENFIFNLIWNLWKKMNGKVWKDAHLHKYSPKDLEKLFEKAGFIIKSKKNFNFYTGLTYCLVKRENG